MDLEKLEKAKVLNSTIERLKKRLDIWERSKKVASVNLTVTNMHDGIQNENVDEIFINFEVLKTLTISAIKKSLSETEKEFENL